MPTPEEQLTAAARTRFSNYLQLAASAGEANAWEALLEGFIELQRQRMGPFLTRPTLAEGFRAAIPFFKEAGMEMEAVDISNNGIDAVLEIQRRCPYIEIAREFELDPPCHVICEMDLEASRRAFPGLKSRILARQALASPVCIFMYER